MVPGAEPAENARQPGRNPRGPLARARLFEVSWEACRQVGGIYTVLRSRAPTMVQRWGDRYCLLGPYDPEASALEFEPAAPREPVTRALAVLQKESFDVRAGRWLVSGRPRAVLLNPRSALDRLDDFRHALREHHGIAAPGGDALWAEVLAFGYLVQRFFRALAEAPGGTHRIIAHFHEWLASAAIPELRRTRVPVSVVFTTHATQLGRVMATHDPAFYEHLPHMDWAATARNLGVEPQANVERAAAHGAHVFTTVSEITADEAEHLLGRRPDVLLPNGLNIERFVAMHEFQNLHLRYKEQIHKLVMALFFPSYTFELDKTLYFFSAGRFEYRNKGYDLAIDSLARLNARLKEAGSDRTIVFFLVTRRPFRGVNAQALHRTAMLEEVRRNCDAIKEEFGTRLFEAAARGQMPDYNTLVGEYWPLRLRRLMHAGRADAPPAVVTHDLPDEASDEVLSQLRYLRLLNQPGEPVKVIYHPDFVTPSSPLFGMDYDQFVRGCHLGVFPSFYEPWGYTPLECVALGTPQISSDLSGFGAHVLKSLPEHERDGLYVLRRRHRSFADAAEELADRMMAFCTLSRRDRIDLRNRVEANAGQFDWQALGAHYADAHRLALAYYEK